METCETTTCQSAAAVVVHWPGEDKRMCYPCADRARGVGRALGLNISFTPIAGAEAAE